MKKPLFLFLAILLFYLHVFGQTWKSEFDISYWGPAEGMGMAFYEILEGPNGFQWLASSNGLYHYDGFELVGHKVHYNNTLGSRSDFYWAIVNDFNRGMWFGTYTDGVMYWDTGSGEVIKYNVENGRFPSNNVMQLVLQDTGRVWAIYQDSFGVARIAGLSADRTIFEDPVLENTGQTLSSREIPLITSNEKAVHPVVKGREGVLWIGLKGGLIRADANRKLTFFPIEVEGEEASVVHVEPDGYQEGQLLLMLHYKNGEEGGVFHYTPDEKKLSPILTTDSPYLNRPPTGICRREGPDPSLFIAADRLLEVNAGDGQLIDTYLPRDDSGQAASPPFEIFSDSGGRLWCTPKGVDPSLMVIGGHDYKSEAGLWCLFPGSKQFRPFHGMAREKGAEGWIFHSLNIDRSGNIWLGGLPGYFRLSPRENKNYPHFESISLKDFKNKQGRKEIWDGLEWNDSTLLLATFNGGLKVVNLNSKKVISHLPRDGSLHSPGSERIFSLFLDRERQRLWLGHERGLDYIHLEDLQKPEKLAFFKGSDHPLIQSTSVYDITEGPDGRLWVGTYGKGLLLFDPEEDLWEKPAFSEDPDCRLDQENINVIRQDSKGNIWVGPGMGGLCKISRKEERYCSECYLNGLYVVDFEEMPDGRILAAAMNYGLVIFNPDTEEKEVISMDNYLLRSSVLGIETDLMGRVWLPSIGLTKFKPDPENNPGLFINYLKESGLMDLDPGRCFFQGASGRFYYSSNQHLYFFSPGEVNENPNKPEVVFTDFRLFNESVDHRTSALLDRPINSVDRISLCYDQNSFSFHFVGIEWRDPQAIRYAYRLDGAEDKWNFVGDNKEARYTQLSPEPIALKSRQPMVTGNGGRCAGSAWRSAGPGGFPILPWQAMCCRWRGSWP
jgi:ligand-binding sensor domain-containing protein